MNKKVYTSSLILIIVFLVAQYVLKFLFPEQFVMCIENPHIVEVGVFIDSHWWLYLPVMFLLGFASDYFFFGACCRRTKLPFLLIIIMSIYNLVLACLYTFAIDIIIRNSNLIIALSMAYMFLVPLLFTNELKPTAITYAIANIAQLLTLAIRDLTPLLTSSNILTTTLLTVEGYLWASLCFVIFNHKDKGEKSYGNDETVVWNREVLAKEKSKSREDYK